MTRYSINQCALFAVKSHKQLAARLQRSESFVRSRAGGADLYRAWHEPKKSGGSRLIEAPRDDLKKMQRRIADLLQRVLPPEYLFCPVKGRSYMDNAAAHVGAAEVRLLDIVDYFGHCTAQSVFTFFRETMSCAPDVAYTLTSLTTRGGHLPQGSPCSPILAFYSSLSMWEEIGRLVVAAGCRITVYVDDITISGQRIPEALIWQVKQILRRKGHATNKAKERRRVACSAEVTGIIVGREKLCVPHRHYRKLMAARQSALLTDDPTEADRQRARARSLEYQIQAVGRLKGSAC